MHSLSREMTVMLVVCAEVGTGWQQGLKTKSMERMLTEWRTMRMRMMTSRGERDAKRTKRVAMNMTMKMMKT